MGYMGLAKQNKQNEIDAEKLKQIQAKSNEAETLEYGKSLGRQEALSSVEQKLMARAQQAEMQRRLYEAAQQQTFANQDVRGPVSTPNVAAKQQMNASGLAETLQNRMRENAYSNAIFRAQREGNMSEANINRLVEDELSKAGGQ